MFVIEPANCIFLVKTLDEHDDDDDDDDDDDGGADGDGDGDGDVDDVDSDGDNAEICWRNIVVWSWTASPKPLSRSRIVIWSLSDLMSLET